MTNRYVYNRYPFVLDQQQRSGLGHGLAGTHLGVDLLDVLALGQRALVGAQLESKRQKRGSARGKKGGGMT